MTSFFGILQSQISSKPKITCWLYCQDSWLRVRGQLYVFCSNFVELMVRKSHYCHEFCISVTWSTDTLCHLMNLYFHYLFPYNIQFMCTKDMIDKSWFLLLLYITHTSSRESHHEKNNNYGRIILQKMFFNKSRNNSPEKNHQ